jgi:hypothetical protein
VTRKPGVFFFSLDAPRTVAVVRARALFHLPYFLAEMNVTIAQDGAIDYGPTGPERSDLPTSTRCSSPCLSGVAAGGGRLDRSLAHRGLLPVRSGPRGTPLSHPDPPRAAATPPHEAKILWNTVSSAVGIQLPPESALTAYAWRLDVAVWAGAARGAPVGALRGALPTSGPTRYSCRESPTVEGRERGW